MHTEFRGLFRGLGDSGYPRLRRVAYPQNYPLIIPRIIPEILWHVNARFTKGSFDTGKRCDIVLKAGGVVLEKDLTDV